MRDESTKPDPDSEEPDSNGEGQSPLTNAENAAAAKVAGYVVLALLGGFVLLIGTAMCWVTVDKGHVGVVTTFGSVSDETLPSGGPYFIRPWRKVVRMNIQTQRNDEPATVPTKGGLSVEVKAVLLYHVDPASAPKILREVGEQYEQKIVDSFFRNAVRDATAEFSPEALYTDERTKVEATVLAKISRDLTDRGFIVESVMLQDPILPRLVKDRIEQKVGAEQDAERMKFVLRQRELEAQAKVVEAKGIADAQLIIRKDLDDNYLKYLWIEALKESAKHNNAVIYVPTGYDGMPLFKSLPDAKSPITTADKARQ
jgi:regulator of protease activity HflC (stomatin/prohibitin superfamily)